MENYSHINNVTFSQCATVEQRKAFCDKCLEILKTDYPDTSVYTRQKVVGLLEQALLENNMQLFDVLKDREYQQFNELFKAVIGLHNQFYEAKEGVVNAQRFLTDKQKEFDEQIKNFKASISEAPAGIDQRAFNAVWIFKEMLNAVPERQRDPSVFRCISFAVWAFLSPNTPISDKESQSVYKKAIN